MHCEVCKRGIMEGVVLHRQNRKGIAGVWRCLDCNFKPVDPVVQKVLDCFGVEAKGKGKITKPQ